MTSSATRRSPTRFSTVSCTMPYKLDLKGDSMRKRGRLSARPGKSGLMMAAPRCFAPIDDPQDNTDRCGLASPEAVGSGGQGGATLGPRAFVSRAPTRPEQRCRCAAGGLWTPIGIDRRAVVDQATDFAEQIRKRLQEPALGSERPYQAGLMGCDTLVLLNEAHLSRPFERLLRASRRSGGSGRETTPSRCAGSTRVLAPLPAFRRPSACCPVGDAGFGCGGQYSIYPP